MRFPPPISDAFDKGRLRFFALARSFRQQLDETGLFPELSDDQGSTLRKSVQEAGQLSKFFMLMCGLTASIAALGLLQSSSAVVIGAMLISPLMGPIAAMGFGFGSLDGRQVRDSARVVAVGSVIIILVSVLLTWISPIRNATTEIIARTEPTLLDLAIAALIGVAGAFATIWQRGAAAAGVAISLMLVPPLATLGYAIALANVAFMSGALLLFLTNLAVISFSFALIARLSGAAKPLASVELNLTYVAAGFYAFLILASPLALQLYLVAREANAFVITRRALEEELNVRRPNIAQLEVKWPLQGDPAIDAVLIAPAYRNDAEQVVSKRLTTDLGTKLQLNIQQVVASNPLSQTRALVNTAVERTIAGITRDVPPLDAIRAELGLPVQALWVTGAERTVQIVPVSGEGWTLASYRALETKATAVGEGWKVNIIPPVVTELVIPITVEDGVQSSDEQLDLAIWAIDRWGLKNVNLAGFSKRNASDAEQEVARANADFVGRALANQGIGSKTSIIEPSSRRLRDTLAESQTTDGVKIQIVSPPEGLASDQPTSTSP